MSGSMDMQDTGTAQFEGTDTIMSLGYAICSFHGGYYQVSDPHHWSSGGTHLWPVGSMHMETCWLRFIDEVAGVIDHFKECYACGIYESLSFCVEEWSWDYLDHTWSQVDYC